ncbi:MAG: N-6 DNA methylase [Deltaproteobacteria bacterium]|nr:N-6 DNA methylase [Deltaproteobacteria bacterium]
MNRSPGHLWAIVGNGLTFRILRDNQALSRQSFLEFDLAAMFDGEVYSDFVLFWLMAHATRFAPREGDRPETCWLEQWTKLANEQGTRALGNLRQGVEQALRILGEGFTSHPKNLALRETLRSGETSLTDFHGQLLRVVYRLIFLFVAEDRTIEGQPLLHPRDDSEAARLARERYVAHYSTGRLRELASRIKGSRHGDLWRQFQLLVGALSGDAGFAAAREHLALPILGSFLWGLASTSALTDADLTNYDFLEALRHLAFTRQGKVLRPVDYKNLGAEELGGVYESLLALTPQISADGARFTFAEFAGSERKTSGSYYTPDSLVQCLLDSALDPVVEEAIKGKTGTEAEKAILALKVCDPAVGSGHFLVGAAHRLARHLARVRALAQGESEPSPLLYQQALRDVIGRCLYGVDINPMAAELCRVSLWLEALEPGKPLSFLDHHIRVGNSLLGATPLLLKKGIPDDAFKPMEGDDNEFCKEYKQRNRKERQGHRLLSTTDGMPWEQLGDLGPAMLEIEGFDDSTLDGLHRKEEAYSRFVRSNGYLFGKLLYDAWCAAFVWKKRRTDELPYPITQEIVARVRRNPHGCPPWMRREIIRLAREYRFFHWHLEFPDVFQPKPGTEVNEDEVTGWTGGFDCVLGNPPWETLEFKEKEWFSDIRPDIADASTETRKKLIKKLAQDNPVLFANYKRALRISDGERSLIRDTDRYPLCARGKINTFSIFAELKRSLLNPTGRVGCIVPSGIATDDTTKFFFQDLMDTQSLHYLYMFENEGRLFPGIDHRNKFALITLSGNVSKAQEVDIVFGVNAVEELLEKKRHFTLTAEDIALLNPNTRTCPIFRLKQDAELTKHIYRRVPVLIKEAHNGESGVNSWNIEFRQGLFNMSSDDHLFHSRERLEAKGFVLHGNIFRQGEDVYLPLYEGKMFWHFDHRFGTYEGQTQAQANQGKLPELTPEQHRNPDFFSLPRHWVAEAEVKARVPKRPEILASALALPESVRKDGVFRALCYWIAGYWRQQGDETRAEKLLEISLRPERSATEAILFNKWMLASQCEKMQERFPLTAADVQRLAAAFSSVDPVPLAQELVERYSPHWFVAFRDVTSAVVLRTAVFSIIPRVAVGHNAPLAFAEQRAPEICGLVAALNSFALDYVARQSVGGSHLTYFILKQLPVIPPSYLTNPTPWNNRYTLCDWITPRVLELSQTAWDLELLAEDCGAASPPFIWEEDRRFLIRVELDAAFFHLYLGNEQEWKNTGSKELLTYFPTPRHAVEYIMDTFRILRERDEAAYGHFKTKTAILEIYDEMSRVIAKNIAAQAAGQQPPSQYQTLLNPPPGPPMDSAGNFVPMEQWDRTNWPSHIHPPRAVERPEEVPFEEFVAIAYPATVMDQTICAMALAIVEQSQGLSSADHLDTLLLAIQPDWLKVFLDQHDLRALETARKSAFKNFVADVNQSIQWKVCREYLEKQHAVVVNHKDQGQEISPGTNLTPIRKGLPGGVDEIVRFALQAIRRIAEMRKNLSLASQEQRNILEKLEQHRVNQLAA